MIQKSRREAKRLKFISSLLLFIEIHCDSNVSSVPMIYNICTGVSVVKRTEIL